MSENMVSLEDTLRLRFLEYWSWYLSNAPHPTQPPLSYCCSRGHVTLLPWSNGVDRHTTLPPFP